MYNIVWMVCAGMPSRDFALQLLANKRCAVAPGIAFNTSDNTVSTTVLTTATAATATTQLSFSNHRQQHEFGNSNKFTQEELAILKCDQFVRISLANSLENVSKGIHLLCDMLEELSIQQPT